MIGPEVVKTFIVFMVFTCWKQCCFNFFHGINICTCILWVQISVVMLRFEANSASDVSMHFAVLVACSRRFNGGPLRKFCTQQCHEIDRGVFEYLCAVCCKRRDHKLLSPKNVKFDKKQTKQEISCSSQQQ